MVRSTATPPSLLYSVKQVELAVRRRLDDLLRPAGITTAQYTALTVLEQRDGLTSAELARRSFVTAQSMGELVNALTRRGLVHREPDPRNGRRLLVRITPAGQDLMAAHQAGVRELERRMVSGLDGEQEATLRQALNSCRVALSQPRT